MNVAHADRARRTALITGASSGIGLAFAHELARRDHDLILVARRRKRLEAIASEIKTEHGINVFPFTGDLSHVDFPQEIFDALTDAGSSVDVIVNNAGFGVPGRLIEVDWERHRGCLEVMIAAPVHLVHLFAPGMAERGYGRIINVSSLAALLPPHSGGTLYYPVKSFLLQFSLAICEELGPDGINVTAVCPGFTDTEFQAAAGGTIESVVFPRALWSSPEDVAVAAIRAAEKGRAVVIPGGINKAIALAFKLLPGTFGRWLVRTEA